MADIEEPIPEAAFKTVDTDLAQLNSDRKDDVESPSLSSSNALARFEFEPGKSKDGTKVLMVEWEDDDTTKRTPGDWEVSWEGKRTVLPARDNPDDGADLPVNRLYFLLGAGIDVPSAVHLKKGNVAWRTNPLPAIFSPELGATARQAGKKGVLHTIWAKKRLQVLQREINSEQKENVEGIGLEMAKAEMDWIEQNFGVHTRVGAGGLSINTATAAGTPIGNTPASPKTPGGGRLMEKLKGLKLGTSDQALASPSSNTKPSLAYHNPLSPEGSDVAVGTFGSFATLKGLPELSSLAAKPPQPPQQQQSQPQRKIAVQRPPESLMAQQRGMGSLNAMAAPSFEQQFHFSATPAATTSSTNTADEKDEDDLFALPISPRSPEMSTSPFTFAAQDTTRYVPQEKT